MALRSIAEVAAEAEKYIDDRRKGLIKSCKTGFKKLDKVLLGGIEYGSVLSIGGRPSVGKTAFSSCLLRGILKNNDTTNMEIIDFIWEMSGRSMLIRDLSAETSDSYGEIISTAEGFVVDDSRMAEYKRVLDRYKKFPWFMEEDPKTTRELDDFLTKRVATDPKKKRIVRIDHSILAKQAANEGSQVTMLQNELNVCVKHKKLSDIIFIILTQLGRDFEERQESGTDKAFPKRSDPFGGDAVAQSSEVVLLLNKPASYGIDYYGNHGSGIPITAQNDLFAHLVKNRNQGGDKILHFKEHFERMSIDEYQIVEE